MLGTRMSKIYRRHLVESLTSVCVIMKTEREGDECQKYVKMEVE